MKVFIEDVTAIVEGVEEVKGKMYIESDSMNYMINVYNGKFNDKGVEGYTNKSGYHTSLANVVKALVKMKIHESTASTLSELLQDIERIESYIDSKIAH
jgi:hypothetical protein